MQVQTKLILFLLSCFLVSACCKETSKDAIEDQFVKITERNALPYTLPILNRVADDSQTRGLFFYDHLKMDVVFRSIGVSTFSSDRARLWVEIKNPDLRMFASTQLDSLFADSIWVGSTKVEEVHNRETGGTFYKLDTALLGTPFSYSQLNSYRPALNENTIVTAHIKLQEIDTFNKFAYDLERGALKRKSLDYIGFKNIKDGYLFFIELENRYTLKSIEVRRD